MIMTWDNGVIREMTEEEEKAFVAEHENQQDPELEKNKAEAYDILTGGAS